MKGETENETRQPAEIELIEMTTEKLVELQELLIPGGLGGLNESQLREAQARCDAINNLTKTLHFIIFRFIKS